MDYSMFYDPKIVGAIYFVAIKYAGYSYAGYELLIEYEKNGFAPFKFGLFRTTLGLIVGILITLIAITIGFEKGGYLFLILILPFRYLEWLFAIWYCYDRKSEKKKNIYKLSFYGTSYSYLLDVPAILSVFVLPGGIWIC